MQLSLGIINKPGIKSKNQNNTLVTAQTVRQSSPYIILYISNA